MSTWSAARAAAALGRVLRYVRREPGWAAEAFAVRITSPLLKRALPIGRFARLMWREPAPGVPVPGRVSELRALANDAGRFFVSTNCLERSALLYRTLSRVGADPVLVLGASPGASTVSGHAWVEVAGAAIDDPQAAQFVPVVAFGRGGRRVPVASAQSAA